jgi:beta-lactamase class A
MRRATFLSSAVIALSACVAPALSAGHPSAALARLESESGGRLGVEATDIASGKAVSYRANERFAMCSTFKFLAVAAILARVDQGAESLDRHVTYTKADLLNYAPITSRHVSAGFMTLAALCEAAIEYSDNTAANLLLAQLGGPSGVTKYARTLGDRFTALNRTEPTLNTAIPGDLRDTTTPAAMSADMHRVLLGSALSAPSRRMLAAWLVRCQTGSTCLRAGLPSSWTVGDKTGLGGRTNAAGASDTRNDIAIAWRPTGTPMIVAVYLTECTLPQARRDATIADVGRIVAQCLPE